MKLLEAEVFSDLTAAQRHAEMEYRSGGKSHMVLHIVIGGLSLLATFVCGILVSWAFMGESSTSTKLPNPTEKIADIRTKIGEMGLLEGHEKALERDVLEHALSFCQDEEIDKILEAVSTADSDLKFPRKFFSNPRAALNFLTHEKPAVGLGVTVSEKEFKSAWEKGLPKREKKGKKGEKKEDPNVSAITKGFADLKGFLSGLLGKKDDDDDKGDDKDSSAEAA